MFPFHDCEPEGDPCLQCREPVGPAVPHCIKEIVHDGLQGWKEVRDLPARRSEDTHRPVRVPRMDLEEGEDRDVFFLQSSG